MLPGVAVPCSAAWLSLEGSGLKWAHATKKCFFAAQSFGWAMSGNCGGSLSTMRFVQLFPKVISKSKHCVPLSFSLTSMYNLWFSEIFWKPVAPWFWFSFPLCLSCWGNSFGRLPDCCCFMIFCAKANHYSVWDSSNMFYPVALLVPEKPPAQMSPLRTCPAAFSSSQSLLAGNTAQLPQSRCLQTWK